MNARAGISLTARSGQALKGCALAPGDKSISHRAILFGALAEGESVATGLLEGDDVLRTAAAMRALGAAVERDLTHKGPVWRIEGAPWKSPLRALYFGNSGTGCRLVLGAAAGQRVEAAFDGDESLRKRPMRRVAEPLAAMGAVIAARDGKLPLSLTAARLSGVEYALPVASAQVKSAVLLAGLGAAGTTSIIEPERSRDHTERMLAAFGARLTISGEGFGRRISIAGGQRLKAATVDVPGDPSSAAFIAAAAAIAPGSDVTIRNVLVNPLRAGFYETLRDMGADVAYLDKRDAGGEPVADIRVRHAALKGVAVPAARAPSMIDEYPVLSVVAAFAKGDTYMPGVEELRVKESDRLDAIEAGLNLNGVKTESGPDWLRVFGRDGDVEGGGFVRTHLDHRIAMSFLVMGLASAKAVTIDDATMIATSYPAFADTMRALGADMG
ncbi:MAG TPA: 3-phosphoshikimate 1-carboxyvinyltransferase [Parvularcula sp.]|nr:3-phosphoshikimate 1-carboxyvinyltransferase [Parvularcula sp.]HBS33419.1 3-phosphoshikimate 1-carboxyvinyltransferase [Parvularcula sp.]HBS36517.1 3-phosphoshikimate 1-carboxyvinyltransferase [Parvularcula sp.]